jgi:hypothetical protein
MHQTALHALLTQIWPSDGTDPCLIFDCLTPSTDASGALGQERPSYDGVVEGGVEGA